MNTIIESALTLSLQKEKFRDQLLYFNTEKEKKTKSPGNRSTALQHMFTVYFVFISTFINKV